MPDQLLEIADLSAGYAGRPVVHGLSLSVKAGEVLALLGPNGAGKTTTLRTVSGVIRPLAGRVTVLGANVRGVRPHRIARNGVAHVAEGRSVFFGLTVGEHFRLGHRWESASSDVAYEYFPQLYELRDRKAGLLSGGEQQMLALGFALARQPRLLLIDELSLGLAPLIVERMLPVVREYATDRSAAVLLVEQHVELALDVADRAIVLSHGEVTMEGEAAVLRRDTELLFASYLGEKAGARPPGSPAGR
jgi:branched-chain amino acid transport system ATP-binding protein